MDLEHAERFASAAERDLAAMVGAYWALVTEASPCDVDAVRDARADVLAAQQVLDLARNELRWQQVLARQREEAERTRVRQEAEAALRALDDAARERRKREREDRTAPRRTGEEEAGG